MRARKIAGVPNWATMSCRLFFAGGWIQHTHTHHSDSGETEIGVAALGRKHKQKWHTRKPPFSQHEPIVRSSRNESESHPTNTNPNDSRLIEQMNFPSSIICRNTMMTRMTMTGKQYNKKKTRSSRIIRSGTNNNNNKYKKKKKKREQESR